jgi:hypothetical protein
MCQSETTLQSCHRHEKIDTRPTTLQYCLVTDISRAWETRPWPTDASRAWETRPWPTDASRVWEPRSMSHGPLTASLDTLQPHTRPMDTSQEWRPRSVSHGPLIQAWTLFSLVQGSRTRHGCGSPDPCLMDPSPQVWTLFSLVRGPRTSHRRGGLDPCLTDPSPEPRHSSTSYEAHGLITGALSLTYGSRSTYMIKNTP